MPETRTERHTSDADVQTGAPLVVEEVVLTSEMLVEEVSIDGMCGVY